MLQNTTASSSRLSPEESEKLFYYFFHLNNKNPKEFAEKWDQIPKATLIPESFAKIILGVAKHIVTIDKDSRKKILNHIEQNIDMWEIPALKQIKTFDVKSKTNISWALAAIDSLSTQASLTSTFLQTRGYLNPHKISHNDAGTKQVYDADLWFTGESDLSPNIAGGGKASFFEMEVRKAFENAEFITETPPVNFIPGLPNAIDFIVKSQNGAQELWVDVDGDSHFLNPDQAKKSSDLQYNINTHLQSALTIQFAQSSPAILRIDMITANKIINSAPQDTDKLCRKLVNSTTHAKSGVYRTTPDQKRIIAPIAKKR